MGAGYTRKQWKTLIVVGCFHFSSAICISLQAPFYPQEAESKGSSASEYGFVFGSFELVTFISSPIIGKYLHVFGVKFTIVFGTLLAALSVIFFGLIDMVNDHATFIGLSFLFRMTEALGSSAGLVAAFSITALIFPNNIATVFGTLEVFYGLGYIVGPSLGGILFSFGNYTLPFTVMGITMSTVAILILFILPSEDYNETQIRSEVTMTDVLSDRGVLFDACCIMGTSISTGVISATLDPHLREFQLSAISNGFIFMINGVVYAILAPFVGKICDKWIQPKKIICFGSLCIISAYLLIGPAPFLPFQKSLTLCIAGIAIHGFGFACLMGPTFIDAISSAKKAGYPDDVMTFGLVSGIWSSSFALGDFIGPSVGGLLFDLVGFPYGSLFVIITHILLFVGTVCFICFEKPKNNNYKMIRNRIHRNNGKINCSVSYYGSMAIVDLNNK